MCTEYYQKTNKYWHFKTSNPDIIKLAKKGIQDGVLRVGYFLFFQDTSLVNGYVELKAPDTLQLRGYKNAVDKRQINHYRVYGSSEKGGFYDSPFGSAMFNSYWTVLGNDITKPKFECASSHRVGEGYVPDEENPQMVYTHHSIWFRGKPPSPEDVQERLFKKK